MRLNSLAFRLIASAAVVSIVILVAAGILLSTLFQTALERNFDARLRAVLDGLLATVELDRDGRLKLTETLADSRFSLPLSGWYWQVSSTGEGARQVLTSDSLLEQRLTLPDDVLSGPDVHGVSHFFLGDEDGHQLRALEQKYELFGSRKVFSFTVAGNYDELKAEVHAFTQTLVTVLVVLGLGLVAAIFVQVQFGLWPIRHLQRRISAIRDGRADRIDGHYPVEIDTVAREIDALIQSNTEVVERARTQVGNLAHALKTPLSVLANEAAATPGPLAGTVLAQMQVMRDQVNLYLDRARRAARAQTLGAATDVKPVVEAIARTLQRINAGRDIAVEIDCADGTRFRGEQQDLEEMVGNLLDNAFKWAEGRVEVRVCESGDKAGRRAWLTLIVGDDGPGLPSGRRHEALKRGHRLDETKPGSGLGLSIVSETAGMYEGGIVLDRSPLGGLQVTLRLPAVG